MTARASRRRTCAQVFDRFYQVDPSRDRGSGTSGLGLAITRAIVEAHGGRTGVENPAGGRRPVLDRPAARPPGLTRSTASGRRSPRQVYRASSTLANRSSAASISSGVVMRPRLRRTAPMPTCGVDAHGGQDRARARPNPAWQAEPVEAATSPSAARTSAPSRPTNETLSVFGRRSSGWPLSTTPLAEAGLQPIPEPVAQAPDALERTQVRRELARPPEGGRQESALGAGPPPGLVARPVDERLEADARAGRRARRRPWARRPCGRRSRAGRRPARRPGSGSCRRSAPRRCGTGRRARGRSRAISAIGSIVPTSLLACMTLTRIGPRRDRPADVVGIDPARTRRPARGSPGRRGARGTGPARGSPGARRSS